MLAVPQPTETETRDNAAFHALLWALSRPGLPQTLPLPDEAAVIGALLDRECRVYAAAPQLLPEIMRTGAEITDIDKADHIFLGAVSSSDVLRSIAIGSDLYPDAGATVVTRAKIGTGAAVRLTGPGIEGDVVVYLDGLPDGFWAARAARIRYPMGFDIYFVDGTQMLGLPRSTTVEVL